MPNTESDFWGKFLTAAISSAPATTGRRYRSLDGLRGIAALVVLVSHTMLTSPVLADAVDTHGQTAPLQAGLFSMEWWLAYTPLHLFWLGTEAVFVFFILSGFVLVGPVLKPGFSWPAYYRQRLTRLYLPVWGSLVFAAAVVLLIPRSEIPEASWWTNSHQLVPLTEGLADATLVGSISSLNSPLWSLQWEVCFSLLLPIYLLSSKWAKTTAVKTVGFTAALFVLMGMFAFVESNALRYLPVFALGVLLFMHKEVIFSLAARADKVRWAWPTLTAICLLLLLSHWLLQSGGAVPEVIISASRLLQVVGAVMAVVIVLCWRTAAQPFESKAVQWLGSRSFSLYLIHDPIVSTVAFLLGGDASPFLTLGISLPVSLIMAEVFFRLVERPSHRLAKRVSSRTPTTAGY